MHPPGIGEEVAPFGRHRGVPGRQPPQSRLIDRLRMRALGDLGKLLRVAEQQEPPRSASHGQGIGQRVLARLVDDQQIQGSCWHAFARHGPGGTANQAAVVGVQEPRDVLVGDAGPRDVVRLGQFLGHHGGIHPAFAMAVQSMFSTTACDWATTPTFQPACTSRAMTCEPTNVLPVPGGPCTAR